MTSVEANVFVICRSELGAPEHGRSRNLGHSWFILWFSFLAHVGVSSKWNISLYFALFSVVPPGVA